MEEKIFLDKIADWMAFDNTRQLMRNENITVKVLHSENIENYYYERIYLVTEKEDEISYSIYILRMFGFNDNINLSQDYYKSVSFDELIVELPKLIKLIIDSIGD